MKKVDLGDESWHFRPMHTLSPEQCRAARAWLDWSQGELAKRAGVGVSTVRDFEGAKRTPIKNNLDAMRRAFEAAGVRMTFARDGRPAGIAIDDARSGPS